MRKNWKIMHGAPERSPCPTQLLDLGPWPAPKKAEIEPGWTFPHWMGAAVAAVAAVAAIAAVAAVAAVAATSGAAGACLHGHRAYENIRCVRGLAIKSQHPGISVAIVAYVPLRRS